MKACVSYSSSADTRVFSGRCVTLHILFAFIHFNHKLHEQSQACLHHWDALDSVSSPWWTSVWLAPQTTLPPPKIEIRNTMKQWSFCQFSQFQAPLHKRKAPLLKSSGPFIETFMRKFRVSSNSRFRCLVLTRHRVYNLCSGQVEASGMNSTLQQYWLSRQPY